MCLSVTSEDQTISLERTVTQGGKGWHLLSTYCVLCAYHIPYWVTSTGLLKILSNLYLMDEQTAFEKLQLLFSEEGSRIWTRGGVCVQWRALCAYNLFCVLFSTCHLLLFLAPIWHGLWAMGILHPLAALAAPLVLCSQWASASFHRRKHIWALTYPRWQLSWNDRKKWKWD